MASGVVAKNKKEIPKLIKILIELIQRRYGIINIPDNVPKTPITTIPPREMPAQEEKVAPVVYLVHQREATPLRTRSLESIVQGELEQIMLEICNKILRTNTVEQIARIVTEELLQAIRWFEEVESGGKESTNRLSIIARNFQGSNINTFDGRNREISLKFAIDAKTILAHYPHVFSQIEQFVIAEKAQKERKEAWEKVRDNKTLVRGLKNGKPIGKVSTWTHFGASHILPLGEDPSNSTIVQVIIEAWRGPNYTQRISGSETITYWTVIRKILEEVAGTIIYQIQKIEQEQSWLAQEFRTQEIGQLDPRTAANSNDQRESFIRQLEADNLQYDEYVILVSHYTDTGGQIQQEIMKQIIYVLQQANNKRVFTNENGDISFFVLPNEKEAWEMLQEYFDELNSELAQLRVYIE